MRFVALILLAMPSVFGSTVAETGLQAANGQPASGYLLVIPTVPFTTPGGVRVGTAQIRVPVVNGRFSVTLQPNDTASVPCRYFIEWHLNGEQTRKEFWSVKTSTAPLTVESVLTPGSLDPEWPWVYETPAGAINGANTTFVLERLPQPAASLQLSWNGQVLQRSVDYYLSGMSVIFLVGPPNAGDTVQATYRKIADAYDGIAYSDAETPAGVRNGSNLIYTLAHTPLDGVTLIRNGQVLAAGVDYTLAGAVLTLTSAPQTGDSLLAWYRSQQ